MGAKSLVARFNRNLTRHANARSVSQQEAIWINNCSVLGRDIGLGNPAQLQFVIGRTSVRREFYCFRHGGAIPLLLGDLRVATGRVKFRHESLPAAVRDTGSPLLPGLE